MASMREKRDELIKELKDKQNMLKKADDEGTTVSDDDLNAVKDLLSKLDDLDKAIDAADEQKQIVQKISALADTDSTDTGNDDSTDDSEGDGMSAASRKNAPMDAGSQFVRAYQKKTGLDRLVKGRSFRMEVKAATDTQTESSAYGPYVTQTDTQAVLPAQRPLTVAALFSQGTIGANNNAIQYPVYGQLEGGAKMVHEAGLKGQLHLPDPTWTTDALKEVAGYFVISDNMLDDLSWIRSEITSYATYNIRVLEEDQLLNGDGTGDNLKGLLNRTGVQKISADSKSDPDRIFEGRRLIAHATGFQPDGIVINPADYEAIRLSRDSNGQYLGGGYFTGQYGNGGVMQDPPLWGIRTVVTEAMPVGTALIGAFTAGGKVFRKGGLQIDSTNSNADDFVHDRQTIRLKERLALQVKYPAAFVAVTLGAASTGNSSK